MAICKNCGHWIEKGWYFFGRWLHVAPRENQNIHVYMKKEKPATKTFLFAWSCQLFSLLILIASFLTPPCIKAICHPTLTESSRFMLMILAAVVMAFALGLEYLERKWAK